MIAFGTEPSIIVAKDGSHMSAKLKGPDKTRFVKAETIFDVALLCHERISPKFAILSGPDRMHHSLSSYPPRLIDPYVHTKEQLSGVGVTRYLKQDARIFHVCNYDMTDSEITLWINSSQAPEIFNPETGEISQAAGHPKDNGFALDLALPKNRSIFVTAPL